MAVALEHILKMKGGSQSHLFRCASKDHLGRYRDDRYFIVKFWNNPQSIRVLANELLAAKLAEYIGVPIPHVEQVEVSLKLVEGSPGLRMEVAGGIQLCAPGRQLGSLFPGDPRFTPVFDWIPDDTLGQLSNLPDFWGALVFDQWLCNTDGRQVVYYRRRETGKYHALMVDQGYCFNDGEWNFPDAPLRGLYLRRQVYERVTGWDCFEPWLTRIEMLDPGVMERIFMNIPRAWCGGVDAAEGELLLEGLYERLVKRRGIVRDLVWAVKRSSVNPFPNWRSNWR